MSTTTLEPNMNETEASLGTKQFATFYVGDLLLAIDISVVQEINRQVDITPVPNAPECVRGVINLRGDVATVIDLRTILGLEKIDANHETRNLIIQSQNEAIGLWVDKISDILTINMEEISSAPANVSGVESKYLKGVYTMENSIAVILDIDQVLEQTA